jgi:hypothetical protein
LWNRAREAVEDEAVARIWLGDALADDVDDDAVGRAWRSMSPVES